MTKYTKYYTGKVREVYDIGYNLLAMFQTDRQSAFDVHICDIPRKGDILTNESRWWFEKTKHIVPNHYVDSISNMMIVKKCIPFMVEVVVRGYITGSTKTSLWTHYNNGTRNYCGIDFPDGLVKNQKLDRPVITPTTKSEVHDEPISAKQVVDMELCTQEEWNYISEKALELFEYGTWEASRRGLILVDTKYEFGLDFDGNILLIDEIHTLDSSRYWKLSSYDERFSNGGEPERFDKDLVRNYVRKQCDPYNDSIPPIPENVINGVADAYWTHYEMLTGTRFFNYESIYNHIANVGIEIYDKLSRDDAVDYWFSKYCREMVLIVAGSTSDKPHVERLVGELKKENIYCNIAYSSAHKQTQETMDLIKTYRNREDRGYRVIYVTVAGLSNALSGVLAGGDKLRGPVIACPPYKDNADFQLNVWSSINMPSRVPVSFIKSPTNVAMQCRKIFNMGSLTE